MTVLVSTLVVILATTLFWGVGESVRQLCGANGGRWPVSIGIGLSAAVFLGGLLNSAHIAYAPVLWTLAAIALILTVFRLRQVNFHFEHSLPERIELGAAAIVIGVVILFTISTQLPPTVFNFHDDFEKYFSHPVRMLATGTLSGSPLSSLGSETLGAEAFLQAFIASALPIGYINGADAVFGFLLMMLLGASAGWRRFGWFPGAMLGALLIAAIDPQYVNISALYLGGALIGTAVLLVADGWKKDLPHSFLLGLVYAALIALKSTFALFVVCHLLLSGLLAGSKSRSLGKGVAWCGQVAIWTAIGLTPWLAMYIPDYFGHGSLGGAIAPAGVEGAINLMSFRRMFYGSGPGDYTTIMLLASLFAIYAVVTMSRTRAGGDGDDNAWGLFAGAMAGMLSYAILVLVLAPFLTGYDASLRLAIPFVMGSCALTLPMTPRFLKHVFPRPSFAIPLAGILLTCFLFAPSITWRYREAREFGSTLAFSPIKQDPAYLSYNAYCLSGAGKQYLREFQDQVPAREPLLVWINTPFLLDYKRNQILDVDTGVGTPWAHIPSDVHYVLWEYRGEGVRGTDDYAEQMEGPGLQMRVIATRALELGRTMSRLASASKVIRSDGQTVLFELPTQSRN